MTGAPGYAAAMTPKSINDRNVFNNGLTAMLGLIRNYTNIQP